MTSEVQSRGVVGVKVVSLVQGSSFDELQSVSYLFRKQVQKLQQQKTSYINLITMLGSRLGSTFIFESSFSEIDFLKNKYWSRITYRCPSWKTFVLVLLCLAQKNSTGNVIFLINLSGEMQVGKYKHYLICMLLYWPLSSFSNFFLDSNPWKFFTHPDHTWN